jgi:hypothetical protein
MTVWQVIASWLDRLAGDSVEWRAFPLDECHPLRASAAPSAGVGLLGLANTPLQTIRSVPVHTISLESLELSGDGPGVSVLQLSVRGL